MKISIKNLNVSLTPQHVPDNKDLIHRQRAEIAKLRGLNIAAKDETRDLRRRLAAGSNAPADHSLVERNNRQMATIEAMTDEVRNLRNRNMRDKARDPLPNTVSRGYHDKKIQTYEDCLDKTEAENDKLRKQLDASVSTDYHDKLMQGWQEKYTAMESDHSKLCQKLQIESNDNVELRKTIKSFEDKIAGYELGMSKAEVAKECDGDLKSIVKRKYMKKLTNEEVWAVRRLMKSGRKNVWIIRHTGLDDATVSRLRKGRSYINVPPEPKGTPKCLPTRWQKKPTTAHAGHGLVKQK